MAADELVAENRGIGGSVWGYCVGSGIYDLHRPGVCLARTGCGGMGEF